MVSKKADNMKKTNKMSKEKQSLLKALSNTSGIIASACKAANISRMTYYRWYDEDPDFREKADDIKELQKDFAESLILKKMKEGDTTMLIFYAKTQMKDRGYSELKEVKIDAPKGLTVVCSNEEDAELHRRLMEKE